MKLIVGLGNPGEKYFKNRHNVGFILIDKLAEELGLSWDSNKKLKSDICKNADLILLKSGQEYMNSSGIPVSLALEYFKVDLSELTVIHDDVDLPFGETRRQFSAGAAGHHGVESVISNLGSKEFWRIRVGIGRPKSAQKVEDFVLENFSEEELPALKNISIKDLVF